LAEIFLRLLLTCNLNHNTLPEWIEVYLIPECDLIFTEEITFEDYNKY
jgi:hypothetical protein